MVNSLQLIVNLPLFNLDMPANAKFFFAKIANIVEFDIFPSDWVGEDMFKFDEGKPFNADFELMDIF